MRPQGPLVACTHWVPPSKIPPEIVVQNLKNIKFWCVDEGALPPVTPVNPYLGGGHEKYGPFLTPIHLTTFLKPHFWA